MKNGITAFIRYDGDGYTLLPCLKLINGLFDDIMLISHPSILDDFHKNQLKYALSIYPNIRHFEYPYMIWLKKYGVFPESDKHTLASYYNFGVNKIETNRWVKIDTDQVYFTSILKDIIELNKNYNDTVIYPYGINALLTENDELITPGDKQFNGYHCDTYIVHSDKMNTIYTHSIDYEVLNNNIPIKNRYSKPAWLHVTQPRRPRWFQSFMNNYILLKNDFNIPEEEWNFACESLINAVSESNTKYIF